MPRPQRAVTRTTAIAAARGLAQGGMRRVGFFDRGSGVPDPYGLSGWLGRVPDRNRGVQAHVGARHASPLRVQQTFKPSRILHPSGCKQAIQTPLR